MDEVGSRLKLVRETLKLTQKEFAERIGMVQNNISALEKGTDRKPGKRVLISIEKEFGVNLKWLGTGDGEMFTKTSDKIGAPILPIQYIGGGATEFMTTDTFRRLERFTPPISNVRLLIPVISDAMEPLIHKGDLLLVRNTGVDSIKNGMLYSFDLADTGIVTAKVFKEGDDLLLKYSNKAYEQTVITPDKILSSFSVVAILHMI